MVIASGPLHRCLQRRYQQDTDQEGEYGAQTWTQAFAKALVVVVATGGGAVVTMVVAMVVVVVVVVVVTVAAVVVVAAIAVVVSLDKRCE